MARLYKSERTLQRARRLRREMSQEERILWMLLRDRRLNQFKFRKQVPLGDYVGDFVCYGAKLVVELDGSQHAGQVESDAKRDAYLREAGFRVLRISTGDLFNERERALETIVATLNAQH